MVEKIFGKDTCLAENERVKVWRMMTVEIECEEDWFRQGWGICSTYLADNSDYDVKVQHIDIYRRCGGG